MNREFYQRIAKARPGSPLFAGDYETCGDVLSFSRKEQDVIRNVHLDVLSRYLPKERIFSL
jgi:hypothetical protein